jgi:hypothetical protein
MDIFSFSGIENSERNHHQQNTFIVYLWYGEAASDVKRSALLIYGKGNDQKAKHSSTLPPGPDHL